MTSRNTEKSATLNEEKTALKNNGVRTDLLRIRWFRLYDGGAMVKSGIKVVAWLNCGQFWRWTNKALVY